METERPLALPGHTTGEATKPGDDEGHRLLAEDGNRGPVRLLREPHLRPPARHIDDATIEATVRRMELPVPERPVARTLPALTPARLVIANDAHAPPRRSVGTRDPRRSSLSCR